MQRYFDVVQSPSGDAIVGGLVSVFIGGTTTLATLYVDNGVTLSPNPVTTNTDGEYAFYAANGTYTLQITATNYATEVKPGVVMFDPSDNVSFGNNVTLVAGTANGVLYLNGSKVVTSGSGLVFDGANLGIGVTPSAWSGVVAMQLPTGAAITGFSNTTNVAQNAYFNGSWRYISTAAAALSQVAQGAHQWFIAPSGTAGNAISFTQAMTLDASGNLGIGTTSPAVKLDVVGEIRVGGAGGTLKQVDTTDDVSIQIYSDSATEGIIDCFQNSAPATKKALYLQKYGGNVLIGSGNLGIGITNPASRIHINNGASSTTQLTLGPVSIAGDYAYVNWKNNPGSQEFRIYTDAGFISFHANATERLRIKSTGQTRFVPLAADPAGAENGDVYYNSTTNKLRVYAGGAWVDLH